MSNNFYQNVLGWAQLRNITKGAKSKRQRTKTWEELGELSEGMAKSNLELAKDSIGDCAVTTANVVACLGLDSVRLGQQATEIAAARKDLFDTMDSDDLLNCFIAHQAIVKLGHDDNSLAFLPFVAHVEDNLAISLAALEVLAGRLNLTFEECQDFAWNEIKDRKGMMINGTFVKEADVEKSLRAVVDTAVDVALDNHAHKFADDQTGALNDTWNAIRGYVVSSIGDTLDLAKSAAGLNAETGTLTVTLHVNAYTRMIIEVTRQLVELRADSDDSDEEERPDYTAGL